MLAWIIAARNRRRGQKIRFSREVLPLLVFFAGIVNYFFVRLPGRFRFFFRRNVGVSRKRKHFIQKHLWNEFARNPTFQIQAIPPHPFCKDEARCQQGSRRNIVVGCASTNVKHLAYRLAMRSVLPIPIRLVVSCFGKCVGVHGCFLLQRGQSQPLTRLRCLRRERLILNHLPV